MSGLVCCVALYLLHVFIIIITIIIMIMIIKTIIIYR